MRSRRRTVAPVMIPQAGRPMVLSEEADQDIRGSLEQLAAFEATGTELSGVPAARVGEMTSPANSFVEAPAEERVERQALASEALSELSRLSSYAPASVVTEARPALQKRTPSEIPSLPEVDDEPVPGRVRTAANVRAMLSGFKAGVERGRTSPSAHRPAPNVSAAPLTGDGGVPQPRQTGGEGADE
jgi:hypothetical protein